MKVALIDYGAGNLHSLAKALQASGADVRITPDWDEALSLDGLVLPGVGAFGHAAAALPGDREPIRKALARGLSRLGMCVGIQLPFAESAVAAGLWSGA